MKNGRMMLLERRGVCHMATLLATQKLMIIEIASSSKITKLEFTDTRNLS